MHCHWLVGRAGSRGSLDAVRLLMPVFFVRGSRQELVREWFAVAVKLLLTRSVCGFWGTYRGSSAVR